MSQQPKATGESAGREHAHHRGLSARRPQRQEGVSMHGITNAAASPKLEIGLSYSSALSCYLCRVASSISAQMHIPVVSMYMRDTGWTRYVEGRGHTRATEN